MEGVLHILVGQARDLPPRDKTGFNNPYCVFIVNGRKHKITTSMKEQTNNPTFDEYFTIRIRNSHEVKYEKRGELIVEVWDWDRMMPDEFIGRVVLPLVEITENETRMWYPLQPKPKFIRPVFGHVMLELRIEWRPVQHSLSTFSRINHKIGAKLFQVGRVGVHYLGKRMINMLSWGLRTVQISSHMKHIKPPSYAYCKETVTKFKRSTDFTKEELELLFYAFRSFAYPEEQMSKERFCDVFSIFKQNDIILNALFKSFNLQPQDDILFNSFAVSLSHVTRGNQHERLHVVASFFDQGGFVERTRFQSLVESLLLISAFADVKVEANRLACELFGHEVSIRLATFLDALQKADIKDEQKNKGASEAEGKVYGIGQCFGLYHYLYDTIASMIAQMVDGSATAHKPEKEGFLLKKSGSSWAKYWFCLRNGFMYYYRDPRDRNPARVMFLETDCTINLSPNLDGLIDTSFTFLKESVTSKGNFNDQIALRLRSHSLTNKARNQRRLTRSHSATLITPITASTSLSPSLPPLLFPSLSLSSTTAATTAASSTTPPSTSSPHAKLLPPVPQQNPADVPPDHSQVTSITIFPLEPSGSAHSPNTINPKPLPPLPIVSTSGTPIHSPTTSEHPLPPTAKPNPPTHTQTPILTHPPLLPKKPDSPILTSTPSPTSPMSIQDSAPPLPRKTNAPTPSPPIPKVEPTSVSQFPRLSVSSVDSPLVPSHTHVSSPPTPATKTTTSAFHNEDELAIIRKKAAAKKKSVDFVPGDDNTFQIKVGNYTMVLAAKNTKHRQKWVDRIQLHLSSRSENPHGSFAPPRPKSGAEYYVDGRDYFDAVAEALLSAREQIFITDWFLSPEVYLKRTTDTMSCRLDQVLADKAKEGVKIFIIIWNETKLALNLHSEWAKNALESLHRNITVICHPILLMKWSHHQKTVIVDQDVAFLGGLDLCFGRYDTPDHPLEDTQYSIYPGKDYYNPSRGGEFDGLDSPFKDLVERGSIPRMPWHDVSVRVDGYAARDVAKNFIQRWNHHRDEIQMVSPLLTPKTVLWPHSDTKNCQILRSLSNWSGQGQGQGGSDQTESSIHTAMLTAIKQAKHFIYIENQYFISSTAGGKVKNEIAEALLQRLRHAIEEKRVGHLLFPTFRVIIVLPVHPEGTYKDSNSIRYIMKWQYDTICRGGGSIRERLQNEFPDEDISDYISFYSLRNYGVLEGHVVTEQIYVHTKLMIVDDRTVIIGSANINDRSMLGDRDSEIAVIIKDEELIPSKMRGRPYMASKFALNLRLDLWREHLGRTQGDSKAIMDPLLPECYDLVWRNTARANTAFYTQAFGVLEGDTVESIRDIDKQREVAATADVLTVLTRIQGHLVEFPLNFLLTSLGDSFAFSMDIVIAGDEVFQ